MLVPESYACGASTLTLDGVIWCKAALIPSNRYKMQKTSQQQHVWVILNMLQHLDHMLQFSIL